MERGYQRRSKNTFSIKYGIFGAIAIAFLLCSITALLLFMFPLSGSKNNYPTAIVEMISAPTFTWTPELTLTSPNPSGDENLSGTPEGKDIYIGDYVEINGTQGDGLRLRSKPGLDGEILFVVYEGEIFKVDDGPQDASGYRWWHLIAPYDENVQGWAVDSYLKTVQQP